MIQSSFIHKKYTERQPSARHRDPLLNQQLLGPQRFPTQVPSQAEYGSCPSTGTNESSVEEEGTTEVIREGCPESRGRKSTHPACPELPLCLADSHPRAPRPATGIRIPLPKAQPPHLPIPARRRETGIHAQTAHSHGGAGIGTQGPDRAPQDGDPCTGPPGLQESSCKN